jgi:hypothetical protein
MFKDMQLTQRLMCAGDGLMVQQTDAVGKSLLRNSSKEGNNLANFSKKD